MDKKNKIIVAVTIILIATALFFVFDPATSNYFFSCPFKTITGYECPGCGSQRAIHQLLHGNLSNAFYLNPLLVISIPILLYGLGILAYNFIFNTSKRVLLFYNTWFIFGYFILAFLFGIYRNTAYYPF